LMHINCHNKVPRNLHCNFQRTLHGNYVITSGPEIYACRINVLNVPLVQQMRS